MSHPDLRTLLMLETTVLSVFEDLVQAHLMPLLMSADVNIKNLHMWHILCSKHKYTGGIHLISIGCSVLYQTSHTSPARQFCRLGPCRATLQIIRSNSTHHNYRKFCISSRTSNCSRTPTFDIIPGIPPHHLLLSKTLI